MGWTRGAACSSHYAANFDAGIESRIVSAAAVSLLGSTCPSDLGRQTRGQDVEGDGSLGAWNRGNSVHDDGRHPRLCDRAASGPSDENNLVQIAEAHDVTTAQVIVAWHLAHGFVVIHKSVRRERIEANAAGARVELTDDEVAAIDSLGS